MCICNTAQLYAGVLALENVWQVQVSANAVRIKELCLHAEGVKNDLRQSFLMFMVDFFTLNTTKILCLTSFILTLCNIQKWRWELSLFWWPVALIIVGSLIA